MHTELPEKNSEKRAAEAGPPLPLLFQSVDLGLYWEAVNGTLPAGLYRAEVAEQSLREAAGGAPPGASGPAAAQQGEPLRSPEAVRGAGGSAPPRAGLLSLPKKFCPGSWMVCATPARQPVVI